MKRSEIVIALANIASQGKYIVDPAGARKINAVFDAAAKLINDLEREENAPEVPRYTDNEPKSIEDTNDES